LKPLRSGDRQVIDERFMRRALELARRGRATTRPNPMVGALVVRDGRILGQGFHRRVGEAHAEVLALQATVEAGQEARGATLYATLEPCCHTGRTGPCTQAILDAGIARVVVACRDPFVEVNGRGIAALKAAGVTVDVGCLEAEAWDLNRPFFTWVTHGRPLVTLKVAATLDGHIAPRAARGKPAPVWITGDDARAAAHDLRAQHQAILVGAGTVIADDPLLTIRGLAAGRGVPPPLRVILDGRLRTPARARVLAPADDGARTVLVGATGAPVSRVRALERAGAEVALLPGKGGQVPLSRLLTWLGARQIQSVLVEGGAQVHGAFVDAGLVDRVAFFLAPTLIGAGVPMTAGVGRPVAKGLRLGPIKSQPVGGDLLLTADVVTDGAGLAPGAPRS
jgi:diaminohydroxyphosphoribosylaminopyrimidine deaminase/5-amino-6-(5-phosphoribosylamino)uracil reductase